MFYKFISNGYYTFKTLNALSKNAQYFGEINQNIEELIKQIKSINYKVGPPANVHSLWFCLLCVHSMKFYLFIPMRETFVTDLH